MDEFLRETRRVLVDGGFLVSVSHMDRTCFFEPRLVVREGDKSWTADAARLWRVDKSASGVEQRFGYFAYVCQVGNVTPPPQPECHEPEPEIQVTDRDGHDSQTEAVAARDARLARLELGGGKEPKQAESAEPATNRQCDTPAADVVLEWNTKTGEIAGAVARHTIPSEHSEVRARVWFELEPLPSLVAATR